MSPDARPRLLIVDDEASVLRTLVRMADMVGFTALGLASGAETIAVLRAIAWLEAERIDVVVADASPPRLDAVVTDIRMPGMDGCTLGREIVRQWPGVRMLFISGYVHEELQRLGICQEDIPLLTKPIFPHVFRARVLDLLASPPWEPRPLPDPEGV